MTTDAAIEPLGRQGVPGAVSPFPLADHVPAMRADDPMVVAFLTARDEVWAPVISTLDCFDDVAMSHRTMAMVGTSTVLHERLVPREAERVEVRDTGGIHTSTTPTDPRQWSSPDDATVVISVVSPRVPGEQGAERLRRIIHDLVPAHVPVRVEVE